MRACRFWVWSLLMVIAVSAITDTAFAQKKKKRRAPDPVEEPLPEPEPEPEPIEEPEPESGWDSSYQEEAATTEAEAEAEATTEAEPAETEEPEPTTPPSWWFGPFVRGVWVPSFMLGLFLDDPPTIANPSFGATATYRTEGGFSLVIGLGYTGYGFEGPLQKSGDPDEDTEWVESDLGLVHLTGQMLWSTELHEMFSIEYGFGVDIGVIIGSLKRWEAYRTPGGAFAPCVGPSNPFVPVPGAAFGDPFGQFCEPPETVGATTDAYDEFGAHYGVTEERIPPVFLVPMIPVFALRFTPVRELALKLEATYGIMQFTFGLSAAYGVDL